MNSKTVTIIGATGLIGSNLLELLQSDPEISSIKVLVRRPVEYNNPKISTIVIDFSDYESFKSEIINSEIVFCAVGTTNRKVKGDKEEYKKIDYDIPVNAARFCSETGCSQFVFVSSAGADSKSKNFYLKFKGSVEDAICRMNIPTVLIFRPSLLLGKRQEFRLGELIGKILIKSVSFLLPLQMKPIRAHDVAKAMLEAARKGLKGNIVFHYKEMKQLIQGDYN